MYESLLFSLLDWSMILYVISLFHFRTMMKLTNDFEMLKAAILMGKQNGLQI